MARASSRSWELPHSSLTTIVCSGAAIGSSRPRQRTRRRVRRASRCESVDAGTRSIRYVDRVSWIVQWPPSTRASWRSWAEAKNPRRWNEATIAPIFSGVTAAMTSTSDVVRGAPNARTVTPPTNTWSTSFAPRTFSAALTTASSVLGFGGIAKAPGRFDEFESHVQRLRGGEPPSPQGGARNGPQALRLSASALPDPLHMGASPHSVLEDSSGGMKLRSVRRANGTSPGGRQRRPDARAKLARPRQHGYKEPSHRTHHVEGPRRPPESRERVRDRRPRRREDVRHGHRGGPRAPRRQPRGPEGTDARDHGPVRMREDDPAQRPLRDRRDDLGGGAHWRPPPGGDEGQRQDGLPRPPHGVHLPGVQPDPRAPHGGERGAPAVGRRRPSLGRPPPRARRARVGRPNARSPPPPGGTLRRPAAAGRDRPRARERAGHRLRRRADGELGLRDDGGDHVPDPAAEHGEGPDVPPRDARCERGPPGAARRRDAERTHREGIPAGAVLEVLHGARDSLHDPRPADGPRGRRRRNPPPRAVPDGGAERRAPQGAGRARDRGAPRRDVHPLRLIRRRRLP